MPFNNTLETLTATIAESASLSDAIALHDKALIQLLMPAAWTAAALTFQVSRDNSTFYNLYDKSGTEYTADAAADRAIIIPAADFPGIAYLKIRSGTSGSAVAQAAARSIKAVIRSVD